MDEEIKPPTTHDPARCAAPAGYATKGPGPTEVMNLTDEYIATVGLLEDVQRLQKLARKWEHNCALYWLQQKEAAFIKHLRRLNHAIGTAWDAADSHQ